MKDFQHSLIYLNFFADVKNFCEDNFPDLLNFVNLLNLEPNLLNR